MTDSNVDDELEYFQSTRKTNSLYMTSPSSRTIKFRMGIAVTTFIICAWVIFFPHPYYWAMGAGVIYMPLLVLLTLIDQDRFELQDPKRSDVNRVNLVGPLLFITCALIIRTPVDFDAESDWRILELVVPISFTIALIVWAILKKANFPLVFVIALLYTVPLMLQLNDLGPSTDEFNIAGPIVKKYTSIRPLKQTIVIRFNNAEKDVYIGREAYQQYKIGEQACAKERKGWLGVVIRYPTHCF